MLTEGLIKGFWLGAYGTEMNSHRKHYSFKFYCPATPRRKKNSSSEKGAKERLGKSHWWNQIRPCHHPHNRKNTKLPGGGRPILSPLVLIPTIFSSSWNMFSKQHGLAALGKFPSLSPGPGNEQPSRELGSAAFINLQVCNFRTCHWMDRAQLLLRDNLKTNTGGLGTTLTTQIFVLFCFLLFWILTQ